MFGTKLKLIGWTLAYLYLALFISMITLSLTIQSNWSGEFIFLGLWLVPIPLLMFVLWRDRRRRIETQIAYSCWFFILPVIGAFIFLHFGIITYSQKEQIEFTERAEKIFKNKESKGNKRFDFATKASYMRGTSLDNPSQWFNSSLDRMLSARKEICISFFYIMQGRNKEALMRVLKIKLKEGVKVFLSVDDSSRFFGCKNRDLKSLEELGAKVSIVKPFRLMGSNFQDNLRSHYKLIVVDSFYCYSGGINIGDLYIHQKRKMGFWNDNYFYFEGTGIAAYLKNIFNLNLKEKLELSEVVIDKKENNFLEIIENQPEFTKNKHEQLFKDLMKSCKQRFYITVPYLIIPAWFKKGLVEMKARGVDVKVMIPGYPDKKSGYTVTRKTAAYLSSKGVPVIKLKNSFVHSKVLIVDGKVLSGSSNFDNRSIYMNYELMFYLDHNSLAFDSFLRKWYLDEESSVFWLDSESKLTIFDHIMAVFFTLFLTLM